MARVRKNMAMQGLTGLLGDQFLMRTDKAGRTIVSSRPVFKEGRAFSQAQADHQEAFREAALYAKGAKDLEVYIRKAERTPQNAYNIAVADWFSPPEVKEVDLSEWDGQAGQVIRVRALDDVKVERVEVALRDAQGTVLEQGPAQAADESWWTYTTRAQASGATQVLATAWDLPGHSGQLMAQTT